MVKDLLTSQWFWKRKLEGITDDWRHNKTQATRANTPSERWRSNIFYLKNLRVPLLTPHIFRLVISSTSCKVWEEEKDNGESSQPKYTFLHKNLTHFLQRKVTVKKVPLLFLYTSLRFLLESKSQLSNDNNTALPTYRRLQPWRSVCERLWILWENIFISWEETAI